MTSGLRTRLGLVLPSVVAVVFTLAGPHRPGSAQQAKGTVYWLPDELASPRTPGDFVTPLVSSDLLFEHHSGTFAPVLAPPYDLPDAQRRQLTLDDWNNATGNASVERVDGGTRVQFDLEGLIPNGVYTAWADFYSQPGFTWSFENEVGIGPLGTPDGTRNGFTAASDGTASVEVLMPPGPVGWEAFVEGFEVPDYVLEPPLAHFALWFAYHMDGKTWGPLPGPKGFEDNTWVGHAYAVVPNVNPGIVIDDFNDGLADNWTDNDYTFGQPYGPSTFEVVDGAYHLCNAVEGCDGDRHDALDHQALRAFRDGTDSLYFANGYLRAKIRGDTNSTAPALLLRSGSTETLEGYEFWASLGRGRIGIWRWNGNNTGTRIVDSMTVGIAAEQDWYFEAGAVGDQLSFKAWRADEDEPSRPQLITKDRRYDSGGIALQSYQTISGPNQPFGASFDEIVWINPGDIDVDGDLDVDDIDSLSAAVRLGRNEPVFDVNRDGAINLEDRQMWVEVLHDTSFGDANLDGAFDNLDIVAVLQAGQYGDLVRGNSGWAQGDWDGDGDFGRSDIVLALQSGAYGQVAMAAATPIPEPAAALLILIGIISSLVWRRRQ